MTKKCPVFDDDGNIIGHATIDKNDDGEEEITIIIYPQGQE